MPQPKKTELLGLNIQQLTALLREYGQPEYRARQLFAALYRQRLESLEEISTLPRQLRSSLSEGCTVGLPTVENRFTSSDGTIRYLMAFSDGQSVETVWMPEGDGGEAGDGSDASISPQRANSGLVGDPGFPGFGRATICVSSQVGCALNCQFCMTALLGAKRNLTAGEILGQIVVLLNQQQVALGSDRINLVFMGMGEPLLNYENFMQAVRLLVAGVGIGESRMTVSTAGIVPRIQELGREAVRPKLAISLNASNNEQRDQLMPINRKWNLEQLLAAARAFPLRPRERLTFEYVLLDGVNDAPENALQVASLLRGIRAKVNLIALNPGPGIAFGTPLEPRLLAFQRVLIDGGVPAFIRRPRGRDIYAACGQLKRTTQLGEIAG
jgi:23S rRNA (adenine2503-C2)-methyltransferase